MVSEPGAGCISIFSSELQRMMSVGSKGAGAGQFDCPNGIAITEDGRVLVADCLNHRIQVLTMEGQFLASVGTKGKGPLQFERPISIMVHPNGKVLVSETRQQSYSSPQPRSHILPLIYHTRTTTRK